MRRISFAVLLLSVVLLTPLNGRTIKASATVNPGIEELSRLDALPAFKRSVKVASVSSYDRTGGNEDGFSGKYSFIRKEAGGLVIADLKGSGVIYRIWTPTPTDDVVEFYFDGEAQPRLRVKFIDLFSGKQFPFLAPVAGFGAGGFYSYVPLPYRESCKIVVKTDNFQFYQINYATYPADTPLASYTSAPTQEFTAQLDKARKLFSAAGTDISAYNVSGEARLQTQRVSRTLMPGQAVTIFETNQPGRVAGVRLGPAQAFAGKARDVLIKFYWDGDKRPAITCPVGDFFGYSWGQPAMKSLLLGTTQDTNYLYLPMPFDKAARIELVSEAAAGGAAIEVQSEVKFADVGRGRDEGKLYALWRRENPTVEGRPFTFVETRGRGHVVGYLLQAQGRQTGAIPEFFEGDDETSIDGETTIRGTGSEDFFNGGWYDVPGRWESRVSLPLSGCLDFKRYLGRSAGYRFLLTDAYAYRQGIRSTIEHGPEGNRIAADYTALTLFYSENRPTADLTLPPLAKRKVYDPDRIVFTPGWTTPIHAFSWANATLLKRDDKVGNEQLRHLSMRAEGREVFGQHYISFICELPAAGKYRVSIEAIEGPTQAIVQIFQNEVGVGQAVDLYAPERRKSPILKLAELDLSEGDNHVMFKLIGKNRQASALNFDLYRIIFEKIN